MGTERDKNVIELILNPMLPFGTDWKEESDDQRAEDEQYKKLPNYEQSNQLGIEGVKLAEQDNFEQAMELFNKAIELCPGNLSNYNNRAQLHRLMANIPDAVLDLEKALELSGGKGQVAAQSFVQMALVHRFQGNDSIAKADFEQAAKLGSKFASNQLVAMNPYAAMCNKMLGELMTKFRQ